MQVFKLPTKIQSFDTFDDFVEEFGIRKGDLVFTGQSFSKRFLGSRSLEADVLIKTEPGEPTDAMIDTLYQQVARKGYTRVIVIGGGAVVDIGKILALKFSGNVKQLFERSIPFEKARELVVIPTTCGTGSEVTNISIAEITSANTKMGLADDRILPDHAVLIPETLLNMPYDAFAYSSMDALIHAMESYLSPKANEFTRTFSVQAIKMILMGYTQLLSKGKDFRNEIIRDFLVASTFAGIAFGNAGVGAVHALSYPLGANYHVPHGESNYQFLSAVLRAYREKQFGGKLEELCKLLAELIDNKNDIFDDLEQFLDGIVTRRKLSEYGMNQNEIITFSKSVVEKQQRLLANNFVPLTVEEIQEIYRSLY